MSSLIMNEQPLRLLPTLAKILGLKEALVLQYLKDCLDTDTQCIQAEKRVWVRRTYEDWQKNLPFWSVDTIKRIILSLEDQNLIMSSKMRESQFDHGKWYTINYAQLEDLETSPHQEEDKFRTNLINLDKHPLWIMACDTLLGKIEDITAKRWLCEIDIILLSGSSVHLNVPNPIVRDWVKNNVYNLIITALEEAVGYPIEKLSLNIQSSINFGDSPSPKKEEGETPPTSPSSPSIIDHFDVPQGSNAEEYSVPPISSLTQPKRTIADSFSGEQHLVHNGKISEGISS